MRGNNLSYEIFRGVNYGALLSYEISLEVASGFHSDLPWMAFFPPVFLSQPAGL